MNTQIIASPTPPNKNENPAVSVIICAYNAAPFIAETLDALLAQTFTDFEAIVVNDGSTDNTASVIQPYLDRIRYYEQPNQGPAAARNTALRVARGQFIAILDSDDLWVPHYLETMVGYLQAHPEFDLIYPNAEFFGSSHLSGKTYQELLPSSHPFTLEKFLTQECSVFGLVTFRREILERVGLYDVGLRGVEDLDLWLRMLQHGYRFTFTREVLVKYRRHESSLSATSVRFYQEVIKALKKFIASDLTTPHQRQLAENYYRKVEADRDLLLAKQEILAGRYDKAKHYLANVLQTRPSPKLKLALLGLNIFPSLLTRVVQRSTHRSVSQ